MPAMPSPNCGLRYNTAEIVRIDNELRELIRSRHIIHLTDIAKFKQLKEERRGHVRVIQNYRPRETV